VETYQMKLKTKERNLQAFHASREQKPNFVKKKNQIERLYELPC